MRFSESNHTRPLAEPGVVAVRLSYPPVNMTRVPAEGDWGEAAFGLRPIFFCDSVG